mgnify:CR=1 FL=1
MDLLKSQKTTFRKELVSLIVSRVIYTGIFIVLPLVFCAMPWYGTLACFFLMHFVCGLILALVFQPAHVINETEFFVPNEDLSVENNWAIHQMKTTANFANKSFLLSWFVGGLNFQVEHHLFPNICHVHYYDLSKIVKSTAEEYNLPYHASNTFYKALTHHYQHLKLMGKNASDS